MAAASVVIVTAFNFFTGFPIASQRAPNPTLTAEGVLQVNTKFTAASVVLLTFILIKTCLSIRSKCCPWGTCAVIGVQAGALAIHHITDVIKMPTVRVETDTGLC